MLLRAKSIAATFACGVAMAASPASAVSYDYDFTAAGHNSGDWSLVGSASWVTDGALSPADRLRLTSNAGGQVGNAWLSTGTVDAGQAWTAEFTWQITFGVGGGADGLGFHVQENGTAANTFFNGAGLSTPYLSVGIDTFDNAEGSAFHVEVHHNGSQIYADNLSAIPGMGSSFDNVYQVLMTYDGANNFGLRGREPRHSKLQCLLRSHHSRTGDGFVIRGRIASRTSTESAESLTRPSRGIRGPQARSSRFRILRDIFWSAVVPTCAESSLNPKASRAAALQCPARRRRAPTARPRFTTGILVFSHDPSRHDA